MVSVGVSFFALQEVLTMDVAVLHLKLVTVS